MHPSKSSGILSKRFALPLLVCGAIAFAPTTRAVIVGPYTPDSHTLHLWHLDESAVPSPDAAIGGTNLVRLLNGATLGDMSFTGFGSAVNTLDGGQDVIAAANKDALITPSTAAQPGNIAFPYTDPTTGAFTLEAMVWIGFDPNKNFGTTANGGNNRNAMCQIMSCDSTANGSRIFQFRIVPKGVAPTGSGNPATAAQPLLSFENIRMVSANQPTIFAAIPIEGPDAIVSNNWYHVAVTYNGIPNTADNIKFYWTLVDSSRTAANQIPITSVQTTLNGPNPLGTANTPFVIGNIGRNVTTAGNNFLGRIDEVRISKVARDADKMLFASQAAPVITEQPVSQTTAPGLPVSFRVAASGGGPLSFQWQHQGTNLPGATNFIHAIAAAQLADAGAYAVVVSNNVNSVTSDVVTLDFTTPINLTWSGSGGPDWNFSALNWDTNSDTIADVAFTQGDTVLFNNQGNSASPINLTGIIYPGAVSVGADIDYILTSSSGGGIYGFTGVSKTGNGVLVMDTDNAYAGPTVIQSGTLQVGNGAGRGNLGAGPVTNNSVLTVNRTGSLNFDNHFAGNGSFSNNAGNVVTINGTNSFSGPITLNAGTLVLATAAAKGPSTEYTLHALGNATTLSVNGGVTFGPDTKISLLDSSATPDNRCTLSTGGGTNTFNCNFVLSGDGNIQFSSFGIASNSLMRVTTPLIDSPAYTGQLILRGTVDAVLDSQLNLGNKVSKTDTNIWTINSTGNSWILSDIAGGTLRMGVNNALPNSVTLNFTAATAVLDLAGTAQTIGTLTGNGIIGSSSTSSDSVLTVNPPGLSLFTGTIQNSVAGGLGRVGLTLAGGNLTLGGTNTYSGDTRIESGTLDLFINGSISNSANIFIASGATLNAFLRTDQTLTLNSAQTLKGDGVFNVQGNIVNKGTIELKLNKSGATLGNDSIAGVSSITYGGTLKLGITASPALTTSDTFALFAASSFSGSFSSIVPSIPAPGLAWDDSTLATDGVLRIKTSTVNETPTNIITQVSGNQLTLSWPESHRGWRLQTQTNPLTVGISTNWVDVPGSTMTNQVVFNLGSTNGTAFFRMVYP